jgi:hypothetical protein
MIYSTEIADEVCKLRLQGMSIPKISHAISRSFPRYCLKSRKQKNFCGEDVLKILQELKADGRLPTTLLDSLKRKIGEKGKKVEVKKPRRRRRKASARPPAFFSSPDA